MKPAKGHSERREENACRRKEIKIERRGLEAQDDALQCKVKLGEREKVPQLASKHWYN